MKIQYTNEFVQKLEMGDPTTCVYKFIYDKNNSDQKKIIRYFIMHRLLLCINVDSYVAHMFYACLFSHNTAVPIAIKKIFSFFPWIQTLIYLIGDMVISINI